MSWVGASTVGDQVGETVRRAVLVWGPMEARRVWAIFSRRLGGRRFQRLVAVEAEVKVVQVISLFSSAARISLGSSVAGRVW